MLQTGYKVIFSYYGNTWIVMLARNMSNKIKNLEDNREFTIGHLGEFQLPIGWKMQLRDTNSVLLSPGGKKNKLSIYFFP